MSDPDARPESPLTNGVPLSLLLELLRHVPACVGVYSPDGTCLAASAALARWLGRSTDSLLGRPVEELWAGEFGWRQRQRLQETLNGPAMQALEEFPSAQGRKNVRVHRFAWQEQDGVVAVVEVFAEQPGAASRAEMFGQLALGMAHDFNNALSLIQGHLDLLELELSRNQGEASLLDDLKASVEHAMELPRQLLRLVWGDAGKQSLDLNALLLSLEKLLRPRLGPNHRLRCQPCGAGAWLEGDPGQLTQMLLNLSLNALQAMPEGGELVLGCERTEGGLRLTVSDTGKGMSAEVRERLFEPLFTTRVGGTGLGLFMVRQIAQRHDGRLACRSVPGRGTTFTIDFSLRKGTVNIPQASDGPIVMVVERDPDIRQLTGLLLSHGGYSPLLCANLEEARRETRHVRLLMLDAEMILHLFGPTPPYLKFIFSFTISGLIALTYSVLAVYIVVVRVLYPGLWLGGRDFTRQARSELAPVDGRLAMLQFLAVLIPMAGVALLLGVSPGELSPPEYLALRLLVAVLMAVGMVGLGLTIFTTRNLRLVIDAMTGRGR